MYVDRSRPISAAWIANRTVVGRSNISASPMKSSISSKSSNSAITQTDKCAGAASAGITRVGEETEEDEEVVVVTGAEDVDEDHD